MKDALSPNQHRLVARQAQIAAIQAHIAYWQTVLVTGAYRDRNIRRGDGAALTIKEKRDDVLATIDRHCNFLREIQTFHEEAASASNHDSNETEMTFPPNMPHSQVRRAFALMMAVRLNPQSPHPCSDVQSIITNAGKFARFISERDDNTQPAKD